MITNHDIDGDTTRRSGTMSRHGATVSWTRGHAAFVDARYSRVHQWSFDGGARVSASASPDVVPVPFSDPAGVDPEEAFVAALSSCHMLWWLHLAAKRGLVVNRYEDRAEGVMGEKDGRVRMLRVVLRPRVELAAGDAAARALADELHHAAHEACFLANSVSCEIVCEPETTAA